jgi:hypothetical protein
LGRLCAGGATMRGVVFEPAVLGRIVRRCDDNSVRRAGLVVSIVNENRVRDHRRRRDAIVRLDEGFHTISGKHFERGTLRRSGQRVRVLAHEERTGDFLTPAIISDRLRNRQDVRLSKGAAKR